MSTTHYITAFWNPNGPSEASKIAEIEIGERSLRRLENCGCDLEYLYEGEHLDTSEELSLDEMLGGMAHNYLKRITKDACNHAYCHILAWVNVLMDVYPGIWNSEKNEHPDDIAFTKSLFQQLQNKEASCASFISIYQTLKDDLLKYHPKADEQVSSSISWSQTVLEFAKAVNDKANDTNGDVEIEFVAF